MILVGGSEHFLIRFLYSDRTIPQLDCRHVLIPSIPPCMRFIRQISHRRNVKFWHNGLSQGRETHGDRDHGPTRYPGISGPMCVSSASRSTAAILNHSFVLVYGIVHPRIHRTTCPLPSDIEMHDDVWIAAGPPRRTVSPCFPVRGVVRVSTAYVLLLISRF